MAQGVRVPCPHLARLGPCGNVAAGQLAAVNSGEHPCPPAGVLYFGLGGLRERPVAEGDEASVRQPEANLRIAVGLQHAAQARHLAEPGAPDHPLRRVPVVGGGAMRHEHAVVRQRDFEFPAVAVAEGDADASGQVDVVLKGEPDGFLVGEGEPDGGHFRRRGVEACCGGRLPCSERLAVVVQERKPVHPPSPPLPSS